MIVSPSQREELEALAREVAIAATMCRAVPPLAPSSQTTEEQVDVHTRQLVARALLAIVTSRLEAAKQNIIAGDLPVVEPSQPR